MKDRFTISRQIGIDMGHRVHLHHSKCSNFHGHRYTIEAICEGQLWDFGTADGMVADFGFLKDAMMFCIDRCFDHSITLSIDDPHAMLFYNGTKAGLRDIMRHAGVGWVNSDGGPMGKVNIIDRTPTAENLAWLWFHLLQPEVAKALPDQGALRSVKVWETPNCWAQYDGAGPRQVQL